MAVEWKVLDPNEPFAEPMDDFCECGYEDGKGYQIVLDSENLNDGITPSAIHKDCGKAIHETIAVALSEVVVTLHFHKAERDYFGEWDPPYFVNEDA